MNDTLVKIRAAFLAARKLRQSDTAAFLGTVIGDIESRSVVGQDGSKTVSEDSVIAVLKSFEKKADEYLTVADSEKVRNEKEIILTFLPQQLSSEQILDILVSHGVERTMPAAMKFLKENYAGQYDGKTASQVVKDWLK